MILFTDNFPKIIEFMKQAKFSICITSYNRPVELIRLLESIDLKKNKENVEIIISEDNSPKREEIRQNIEKFKHSSDLNIFDYYNDENLGYDRNLGKLISLSSSEYIMFMSDDDSFIPGKLDVYVDQVLENAPYLAFSPFKNGNNLKRKYKENFKINPSKENAAKHIYDAILFSGLTFKKSVIENVDSEKFLNTLYFQVYLFLITVANYGAFYIDVPVVNCNGDGENGFGLSASSIKNNKELINRKSPLSMLEYHKGLVSVIRTFDKEYETNALRIFSKMYSLKSYYHLSRARHAGKSCYREAKVRFNSLGIELSYVHYIYRYLIASLGVDIADSLMEIPKRTLIKLSSHKRK